MVLDYKTAEIVKDDRTAEELQSWPESRMVICLDDYYSKKAMIDGKTIYQYERALIEELGEDAEVRVAADSYNKKSIGLRLLKDKSDSLFAYLSARFKKEIDFQIRCVANTTRDDNTVYGCIFAPLEKADLLHAAILQYAKFPRNLLLKAIEEELSALRFRSFFFSDTRVEELKAKQRLLKNLPFGSDDATVQNIYDGNPASKVTIEEVMRISQLDEIKLAAQPPEQLQLFNFYFEQIVPLLLDFNIKQSLLHYLPKNNNNLTQINQVIGQYLNEVARDFGRHADDIAQFTAHHLFCMAYFYLQSTSSLESNLANIKKSLKNNGLEIKVYNNFEETLENLELLTPQTREKAKGLYVQLFGEDFSKSNGSLQNQLSHLTHAHTLFAGDAVKITAIEKKNSAVTSKLVAKHKK